MKSNELGEVVLALGRLQGEWMVAEGLTALGRALSTESVRLSDWLRGRGETISRAGEQDRTAQEVLPFLRECVAVMSLVARADVDRDVRALVGFLESRPTLVLGRLADSPKEGPTKGGATLDVRQDLVEAYAKRLPDARLGSAEYGATVQELEADRRMRKQEMQVLARLLGHRVSPSASRAAALKEVRQRHDFYNEAARKSLLGTVLP